MNGGTPDSPDNTKLIYARKKYIDRPDYKKTELWICNHDLSGHRKIFEVDCGNHNGPSATFIDNDLVVFRGQDQERYANFYIYSIERSRLIYGPFVAKESHRAEHGLYPFSISEDYVGKNPDYPQIGDSGIYVLEIATENIRKIVDTSELLELVQSAGYTPDENTANVSHVQLNPSGTQVMMRVSVKECRVLGALACFDLVTGERFLIPDKPIHQLWYDDNTYMASFQEHDGRQIVKETARINRYTKDGKVVEPLGGVGNHLDGSPDRRWFVGDTVFQGSSIDILLYRKGETIPAAKLDSHRFISTVFNLKVHPNPTFSVDGRRVYFNRPVSADRTVAGFIDITGLL